MTLPFTGARLTLATLWRALPWALFLAVSLYALIAINGFGVRLPVIGFVGVEGYAPANARLKADLAGVVMAQAESAVVHRTAKETAEQILAQVAEGVETNAQIRNAAAADATARFIDANRLRCPSTGGAPGPSAAATANSGSRSAEGPPGMSELAGVLVPERDIRICADNTVKAIAGHELATQLERVTAEANRERD